MNCFVRFEAGVKHAERVLTLKGQGNNCIYVKP
jgi:hypothetical protein